MEEVNIICRVVYKQTLLYNRMLQFFETIFDSFEDLSTDITTSNRSSLRVVILNRTRPHTLKPHSAEGPKKRTIQFQNRFRVTSNKNLLKIVSDVVVLLLVPVTRTDLNKKNSLLTFVYNL